MTPEIRTVELPNQMTLQYVEQGEPAGVPVLLLHGLSDSWHSYELVLPHLPASIRALALTQRGHGDSSSPKRAIGPTTSRRMRRGSWMRSSSKPLPSWATRWAVPMRGASPSTIPRAPSDSSS